MHFICLTPTYGRPSLVANALMLFLDQELPAGDTAYLAILDDACQIRPQSGRQGALSWEVFNAPAWIPLPRKYAALLDALGGITGNPQTVYVVWDDDDVYLPWHLAAIGAAIRPPATWAHPSRVWSTYGIDPAVEMPRQEPAAGRFHGALAIWAPLLKHLGGWPDTELATYDQQMLAALAPHTRADPCDVAPASYCYRWGDTGKWHASGTIDDGRYRQPPIQEPGSVEVIRPRYDKSTVRILQWLAHRAGG